MDHQPDPRTPPDDQSVPARQFAALAEEQDATYPMLAPAASLTSGHEEDVFDEQILAGLVNV
jgi:hypothetical protein